MKRRQMPTTNVYKAARERLEHLSAIAKECEVMESKFPEGTIRITGSHGHVQYRLHKSPRVETNDFQNETAADRANDFQNETAADRADDFQNKTAEVRKDDYLRKSQESLIRQLLQKRYNKQVYKMVMEEMRALERLLIQADRSDEKLQMVYAHFPEECREMIEPFAMTDEEYARRWRQVEYVPKEIPEFQMVYCTERGEYVRSKSELNIANALNRHGIPYRYECPLRFSNGVQIYPDFTILDQRNRKNVYWEHRGMMEDREYAKHTVSRVKDYGKNGIFPGYGLIITEESATVPLGTNEIEAVIKFYFERNQ